MSTSNAGQPFAWMARSLLVYGALGLQTVVGGCGADPAAGTEGEQDSAEDDDSSADGDADEGESPSKPSTKPDSGSKPANPKRDAATASRDAAASADAGAETPKAGAPATPAAFCDVLALAKKRCAECHDGEGSGPMNLLTYEDFLADAPNSSGKKVWEVVKTRIHDERKPMPPTKLADDELAVFDGWLNGGAKPGDDPTCAGQKPTTEEPDLPWPPPGAEKCEKLVAYAARPGDGVKATVVKNTEPHPQFIFDAPWGTTPVHALGFRPVLDNKKVLHHWILYPNANGPLDGMIIGWAPGGEKARIKMPDEVGFIMPTGEKSLRLDMHYYNLGADSKDEQDASGVEVCYTTKLRKFGASIFMHFGSVTIDVPPMSERTIQGTCTVQTSDNKPVYLLSTVAHAHNFAKHMKFTVERAGQSMTMYDGPFVFEEQQSRMFDTPWELRPGDRVVTRCTYKNDTAQRVTFGENTGNEMCFNYTIYYPSPNLSCAFGTGIYGLGI